MTDDPRHESRKRDGGDSGPDGDTRQAPAGGTSGDTPASRDVPTVTPSNLPTVGVTSSSRVTLPERIGRYKIIRLLGEGGMGIVYEAQQPEPRRRVALKVIRGGAYIDEAQLRLFKREADTLGLLKHTNIAAIYESGRTDEGQHFFAMELVAGETLAAYLRKRPKTVTPAELRHRLALFRQIAEAVHYAHQKGVIHRDLKPGNVIVTAETMSTDGSVASAGPLPTVKVLDFGLARITEGDLAATMTTEVGAIKGTLPYMSPEQARGRPQEIDLRTDVYALGVILYEMLTGHLPYDVMKGGVVEALRVICEESPQSLSQSWSGSRRLDPDVETIVGKALEKEAERRYGSAAELAADVERYLASQPIQARPPSTLYQLRKFTRRNRVLVGGVLATFAVLVAGIVWSEIQRREAETQARRAEASTLVELGRQEIDSLPTLTVAYARKSLEIADTERGRLLALEALTRAPIARKLPVGEAGPLWKPPIFSPDGRWMVAWDRRSKLLIANQEDRTARVLTPVPPGWGFASIQAGTRHVWFGPDFRFFIIAVKEEGVERGEIDLRVHSFPDGEFVRSVELPAKLESLAAFVIGTSEIAPRWWMWMMSLPDEPTNRATWRLLSLPRGEVIRLFTSEPEVGWQVSEGRLIHWIPLSERSPDAPEGMAGWLSRRFQVRAWSLDAEEPEDLWVHDGVGTTASALATGSSGARSMRWSHPKGPLHLEGTWTVYAKGREVFARRLEAGAPEIQLGAHEEEVGIWKLPWQATKEQALESHPPGYFGIGCRLDCDPASRLEIWSVSRIESGPVFTLPDDRWWFPYPGSRWLGLIEGSDFFLRDAEAPREAEVIRLHDAAASGIPRGQSGYSVIHGQVPNGRWAVTYHDGSGHFQFWPLVRRFLAVLRRPSAIMALSFAPDSRTLISCPDEGVRAWKLSVRADQVGWHAGRNPVPDITGPLHYCASLDVNPSSGKVLWSGDNSIYGLLSADGEVTERFDQEPGEFETAGGPPFGSTVFDAVGRRFALAAESGAAKAIRVHDLESGESQVLPLCAARDEGQASARGHVAGGLRFSPDGASLYGAGDGGVRRWDLESGTVEWLVGEEGEPLQAALDLTPDGRFLVVVLKDGVDYQHRKLADLPQRSFGVHDLVDGTYREITTHGSRLSALALDASGEILVTGDWDGRVRVGRLDGSEPHLLLGHDEGRINALAVSPDGRWIASAAGSTIRIWPMPDLERTPFHLRPYDEVMEVLSTVTNIEVVEDPGSTTGWKLAVGPFPGWGNPPVW